MPKLTFILLDKIRVVSSIERKFGRCHPFNRFQTVHLTRRCLQSPRQGDDLYLNFEIRIIKTKLLIFLFRMPGPDNNPQDQVMIYIQLRRIIKTKIFIFLLQKAAEELTDGETAACCCLLCMGASCWACLWWLCCCGCCGRCGEEKN